MNRAGVWRRSRLSESAEQSAWHRLSDAQPWLLWQENACLPARSPLSDCHACSQACPVDALTATPKGPQLTGDCVACGRCTAACPTGAINGAGLDSHPGDDQATAPLAVDCWRVPPEQSPEGALRVPCLGGLGSDRLLRLVQECGERPVELLDRGWCADCPAAADCRRPPVDQALTECREALASLGLTGRSPSLRKAPLPAHLYRRETPTPGGETRVSRRGLFRRLAGHAAGAAEQIQGTGPAAPAAVPMVSGRVQPAPRLRRVEALAALAVAQDQSLPNTLFPQAKISDACCNHRICAALCPTGALQPVEDEDGSGLDYDPLFCIRCGLCQQVCPEKAITITERDGHPYVGRVPATRHHRQRCQRCHTTFTAGKEHTLCPGCRKDAALAQDSGRDLLFGAGSSSGAAGPAQDPGTQPGDHDDQEDTRR